MSYQGIWTSSGHAIDLQLNINFFCPADVTAMHPTWLQSCWEWEIWCFIHYHFHQTAVGLSQAFTAVIAINSLLDFTTNS